MRREQVNRDLNDKKDPVWEYPGLPDRGTGSAQGDRELCVFEEENRGQ